MRLRLWEGFTEFGFPFNAPLDVDDKHVRGIAASATKLLNDAPKDLADEVLGEVEWWIREEWPSYEASIALGVPYAGPGKRYEQQGAPKTRVDITAAQFFLDVALRPFSVFLRDPKPRLEQSITFGVLGLMCLNEALRYRRMGETIGYYESLLDAQEAVHVGELIQMEEVAGDSARLLRAIRNDRSRRARRAGTIKSERTRKVREMAIEQAAQLKRRLPNQTAHGLSTMILEVVQQYASENDVRLSPHRAQKTIFEWLKKAEKEGKL